MLIVGKIVYDKTAPDIYRGQIACLSSWFFKDRHLSRERSFHASASLTTTLILIALGGSVISLFKQIYT